VPKPITEEKKMSGESDQNMDIQEILAIHRNQRKQLMDLEKKMRFSYDLEASLTNDERRANLKLLQMRDAISLEGIHNLVIKNFHDNKKIIENSQLYRALYAMPKGANHHVHPAAAKPVSAYIEVIHDARAYYSVEKNIFKVFPKHQNVEEGFV